MAHRPDLSVRGIEKTVRGGCAIACARFDGTALPLKDHSVDLCMFVDVLHHTDDVRSMLREAVRVSRGYLLIKDHVFRNRTDLAILKFMDWFGNRPYGADIRAKYFTREQWSECFTAVKLDVVHRNDLLEVYPSPLNLIFERDLHFAALLKAM